MMTTLAPVRAQGAEAKKLGLDHFACPYGPGDLRDAWIGGHDGVAETVEQVDASTANRDDVRVETPQSVRKGSTRKGAAKDAVTVTTGLTGTGETSLKTVVEPTNPELGETAQTPSTVIGDPAASTAAGEALND